MIVVHPSKDQRVRALLGVRSEHEQRRIVLLRELLKTSVVLERMEGIVPEAGALMYAVCIHLLPLQVLGERLLQRVEFV